MSHVGKKKSFCKIHEKEEGEKMTRPLALEKEAAPWGLLTSLDLYHCNPDTIRSADKIQQYVFELCKLIEMRRFGECQVIHFGEDERVQGYSMVQ